jgi:hypothetical protein
MRASAWIMLAAGSLILYGGLAWCLALAAGLFGRRRAGRPDEEAPPDGSR